MDYSSWGSQYMMDPLLFQTVGKEWVNSFLSDSFAIPFVLVLFLICIQIFQASAAFISDFWNGRSTAEHEIDPVSDSEASNPVTFYYLIHQAKENQGMMILAYATARLAGCLTLFGLSTKTLLGCPVLHEHRITSRLTGLFAECPEAFMTLTYFYCSILAIASMTVKKWTTLATRYNILILLSALGVYVYRDIWPLATYTDRPKDISHDNLLWFKVVILAFTAVVVPLFVPRRYIPVDPKSVQDPMPVPNDEQTCSLFSLIYYFYLDPVIFLGYRLEHLESDQLPPLSDTDQAKNLVKRAFPYLDPYQGAEKSHLFFGMMKAFRGEYIAMAFTVIIQVAAGLFSPVGINRILNYLETGGQGAYIRPWFWILVMFVGPSLYSLALNWYVFAGTRAVVRAEALIIQLVFEHSLRIRLVAETAQGNKVDNERDNSIVIVGTSDTASVDESSTNSEGESSQSATKKTPGSSSDSKSTLTASSTKGKSKDTTPTASKNLPSKKDGTNNKDSNLIGKINNLVTTDLGNIVGAKDFLILVLGVPLQICVCTFFLYQILGWSAFVGLAIMIILLPVPGYAAKLLQSVQGNRMKMTDARVQDVSEVVGVLRMVKLFGWESKMSRRIQDRRNDELAAIWKFKVLEAITGLSNSIIPTITMVATYATYTVIMKQSLTPSVIFSSVTVFGILRGQLYRVSWQMSTGVQGKVSLDRVSDFLRNTELLDSFTENESEALTAATEPTFDKYAIGFKNAIFSWSLESHDGSVTPSRRAYRLRIDDELLFKPDCINLIIGPTGSGKTSILMALLGEMHFIRSSADSWFSLPSEGGVAYAAQESWVQNATIRDNILFRSPYEEARYRKVLHQCGLMRDLELFDAGDATEVGEKGITLSGGQKARVTLARAIYSQAKIILLDDVFAALDMHTSVWIVNKCFRGDLVKGRTVLLVTHNVDLLTPVAQFIVSIGQDGVIRTQGVDPEAALAQDPVLTSEVEVDCQEMEVANEEVNALAKKEAPGKGKLVVAEEIAKGHVTWKSMKLFLSGLGGDYPLIFFSLWVSGFLIANWVKTFQTWFLGYWGSQYENRDPSDVQVSLYLSLYSLIVFGGILLNIASYFFYVGGSIRASRVISTMLVNSILSSTLRWLDETPTARIIARCTQDIRVVDGLIAQIFMQLADMSIAMLTNIGVIIIFTPIFLFPGLAVAALGFYLGHIYLQAQLSVKREMSNAKSPVLAHFGAAIAGLVSVRAYGAQSAFKADSIKRIDHYVRISRISWNLNRWVGIRIDLLGQLFTVALATYLVYGHTIGASNTGFSLNMAVDFCTMILWWVRYFNRLEVESNSLERIQGYLDIDHEPPSTKDGKPPAAWPTSGEIVVETLSARYSQDGPTVLRDLSFRIESGQRVGVVGRTGSGKSTLTLALMRCVVTEGTVYYDGISTNKLNLEVLRSNVTIIPQMPELISGTLRRNLDPFEQHDDATLNDALRSAGLFSVQEQHGEGCVTLDSNISSGGSNLSVGEKQIVALARAMVRGSKLLILDEATSAIDYKTDAVIQTTLRQKLASDVTVITVAHRLQTIMDADKIMVLDDGRIAEFDTPKSLLQNEGSMFKSLVDCSEDRAALYAIAEGKAATTSIQ